MIDFRLTARRDAKAARAFLNKALNPAGIVPLGPRHVDDLLGA